MKPKPNIEVATKPSTGNKFRQAPVRDLKLGDVVQVRWFMGKTKWLLGRVTKKIGNKLYELEVRGKKIVRHIHHLLQVSSELLCETQKDSNGTTTNDWYDSIKIDENVGPCAHMYPRRIRRPVVTYSIDE